MKTVQQTQVKSRPILFSGAMIRAILNGQKTQTRRVVKPKCGCLDFYDFRPNEPYPYYFRRKDAVWDSFKTLDELCQRHCPYGKAGDRLWVRESWFEYNLQPGLYYYRATDTGVLPAEYDQKLEKTPWKSPIHMPRWASRITLEITNVWVERLQDISEKDAIAEGIYKMSSGYWTSALHSVKGTPKHMPTPIEGFMSLWDSINVDKHPWSSNPYVWVVAFKAVYENS